MICSVRAVGGTIGMNQWRPADWSHCPAAQEFGLLRAGSFRRELVSKTSSRGPEGLASWAVYGPHSNAQRGPLEGAIDREPLYLEPYRGLLGTNAIHS